jgi:TrpR-related protein YerC/YecD
MNSKKLLYKAILSLETEEEVHNFLKDLCTPKELSDLAERLNIAKILSEENLSYQKISEITSASITTIGRVNRFLKNEPNKGYELVLNKLKNGALND